MKGRLGEERRSLSIVHRGFGMGFFSPCDIRRVDLIFLGEECPCQVELGQPFVEYIEDGSDFFDDS